MMKVIITYASAGAGHLKAAEAIHNYLKEYHQGVQVQLVDVLKTTNALWRFIYTRGYSFLVEFTPFLWKLGFWVTYFEPLQPVTGKIALFLGRFNTKRFAEFLIRENPDFIVSTHFLASEISAYLKRQNKIDSRLVTIITDFGVHPLWVSRGTDTYIVASEFTKQELLTQGVEDEKVKVLGIPTDLKFLAQYHEDALCKKFNLDKNKFTVLIATGSFGIGPIEEIVNLLHNEAQVLVVCAKNKKLYARLKQKQYHNTRAFGFIDNIQELMAVSDVIITKPGGLSIAESLNMGLFPIFIVPIPGQETENIKCLEKYGIGAYPRAISLIKDIVLDLKQHPDKLRVIKEKINTLSKPFATSKICDVICEDNSGAAC